MSKVRVSYKPLRMAGSLPSTVRECLNHEIYDACHDPHFIAHVMEPLRIKSMMTEKVMELPKEPLQRLLLCLCLGKVLIFSYLVFFSVLLNLTAQ